LTKKEELVDTRILAAETLAYMIEVSEELQRIAAISNHLVPTMASFLWWEPPDALSSNILRFKLFFFISWTAPSEMICLVAGPYPSVRFV
jgi:hypothetical protein